MRGKRRIMSTNTRTDQRSAAADPRRSTATARPKDKTAKSMITSGLQPLQPATGTNKSNGHALPLGPRPPRTRPVLRILAQGRNQPGRLRHQAPPAQPPHRPAPHLPPRANNLGRFLREGVLMLTALLVCGESGLSVPFFLPSTSLQFLLSPPSLAEASSREETSPISWRGGEGGGPLQFVVLT